MHIKQITISNFRSFRQQPEIHPFAASTNCVVGRNGSGKSNLFDAIQFVLLSPRFATLRSVSESTSCRLLRQTRHAPRGNLVD
jgi:structural maintenance of chromosome 3 (chondroitin sulfate proteoglycan 6)